MSEIGIKDQCFGVEVEMTGITREQPRRRWRSISGQLPAIQGAAMIPGR